MTVGPEPITAPGIHDAPAESPATNALVQSVLKGRVTAIRYHLLADVLYAVAGSVSGIPLLGPAVSDALSNWADDLEQQALDALNSANNAQDSANYANARLTVLLTGLGISAVPGGVSLSYEFSGSSANNLGSAFTRSSSGSGGGHFGPDGNGLGVWKKSGGLDRTHLDRHNTALNTRYQVVAAVMSKPPEGPYLGGDAYTWLRGRINAADDTYVYARVGNNDLQIGCVVAGTPTEFDTVDFTPKDGDDLLFLLGTDVDDREFVLKRNGVVVWRDTDDADVSQVDDTDYLYAGLGASAANRAVVIIPFLDQTRPGHLDAWAAADRLPANI